MASAGTDSSLLPRVLPRRPWLRLARSTGFTAKAASQKRLVVVGNGMVGQRLCERLVELSAQRLYRILVLSEEPHPAYDRVHLGDVLAGRAPQELFFRSPGWYQAHGIELRLDDAATELDPRRRRLVTRRGERIDYDRLVLATGSRAVMPPVPTSADAELVPYRTLDDVERVLRGVRQSRAAAQPVAIIGAGLLGIEAARSFQRLGARVVLFEASSQLLPRQLDAEAAATLAHTLKGAGLQLELRRQVARVERTGPGHRLHLADGARFDVGAVVVAVGARAADELAKAAGLRCHPRGGVEVDARLRTSAPDVYAIGECASHHAVPHGLVAPGYVMADILADNLLGRRRKLGPQAAVTRLKLDLTEVTVLGDPVRAERDREVTWSDGRCYRRVQLLRGRVTAAVAIGAWDELPELQNLVGRGGRVTRRTLESFLERGSLAQRDRRQRALGDADVVCQCANVSCGRLRLAIRQGHCGVEALSRETGAGTLCGSCLPQLAQLAGATPERAPRERVLPLAAGAAGLLAMLTLASPRVPLAGSALDQGLEQLWVSSILKQVSGFSVVAFVLLGLALSLHKRLGWLRFWSYRHLRAWHALLGVVGLAGLFLHTGFRMGRHLDFALMLLFLVSALTGALSAMLTTSQRPTLRFAALALRKGHELSFWPLPVLVLFHALKTYYF